MSKSQQINVNTFTKIIIGDIFVRVPNMINHNNHLIIKSNGLFELIDPQCNHFNRIKPYYYCTNCQQKYIIDSDYTELAKQGAVMIQAVGKNPAEYSKLRSMGYTVNKKDNLSDKQRQEILRTIYINDIMTKEEILNYLNLFIWKSARMTEAVEKWQSDIKYINTLRK